MSTPNLGLENWDENIEQPDQPFNANVQVLDTMVQTRIEEITATPPTTVDADRGKSWIVGIGATGAWDGHDDQIAICIGVDLWRYIPPAEGLQAYDKDQAAPLVYDGAAWVLLSVPTVAAAEDVSYDPTASGIPATDVQEAIDYLAGSVGAGTAPIVVLSGTTYTLDDLTNGAWHVFTNAGLVTITVMNDAVEAVAANAEFGLDASGAAGVEIVADDDAVILPPKGGSLTLEEDDFAVLKRRAADDYRLVGSTEDGP